jgi:hypothetical protein
VLVAVLTTPALAGQEDPTGRWTLHAEWPNRPSGVTLTVARDGDALVATWEGRQGTLEGKEVAFAGDTLTFNLEVEQQNRQPITLRFEGKIAGDRMTGVIRLPQGMEIPASGNRAG